MNRVFPGGPQDCLSDAHPRGLPQQAFRAPCRVSAPRSRVRSRVMRVDRRVERPPSSSDRDDRTTVHASLPQLPSVVSRRGESKIPWRVGLSTPQHFSPVRPPGKCSRVPGRARLVPATGTTSSAYIVGTQQGDRPLDAPGPEASTYNVPWIFVRHRALPIHALNDRRARSRRGPSTDQKGIDTPCPMTPESSPPESTPSPRTGSRFTSDASGWHVSNEAHGGRATARTPSPSPRAGSPTRTGAGCSAGSRPWSG